MFEAIRYFLFKRRRQKYLDQMYVMNDPWSARLSEPRVTSFIQRLKNNQYKRVLDVGCGEAVFAEAMGALADQYVGIDVSSVAIKRAEEAIRHLPAREAQKYQFRRLDFDRIFVLPSKYDLVCFNFVLDYMGFQKHPKLFAESLYLFFSECAEADCTVLIMNPVYEDSEFEKINQYIYVLSTSGFKVIHKEIIQENTFKIACVRLQRGL